MNFKSVVWSAAKKSYFVWSVSEMFGLDFVQDEASEVTEETKQLTSHYNNTVSFN